MSLPVDYPVLENPAFVLYGKATGMTDAQVAAGYTPPSRGGCVGSVSSRTGFASVSGGYSSADLTITPQLDGSFAIVAKKCSNTSGDKFQMRATFTATFTTNGQPDVWEAGTKTYTFHVIVLSRDYPYYGGAFREIRDDRQIDEKKRYSPSYVGFKLDDVSAYMGGLLNSFVPQRYASGLMMRRSPDEGEPSAPVFCCDFFGETSRIGVYACGLYAKTRNWAGRQLDGDGPPLNQFPFGEFTTPFICSVYTPWMPGELVVAAPDVAYARSADTRRLLYHDLGSDNIYKYLAKGSSGDAAAWTRTASGWISRTEETITGTQHTIKYIWEYVIALSASTWTLTASCWTTTDGVEDPGSRETRIADTIAQREGETIAPVNWPHTRWQGDTACWISGHGFFSRLADGVLEQEVIYTRRQGVGSDAAGNAGWGIFPAELQFTGGEFCLRDDQGKWMIGDTEVTPEWIGSGTVVPYAPPRLDDRTLDAMSISGDSGPFALGGDTATGYVWSRYPLRRHFPLDLTGTLRVTIQRKESVDKPQFCVTGQWLGGPSWMTRTQSPHTRDVEYQHTLTIPLDCQHWTGTRDKILERLYGGVSSCEFTVSEHSDVTGSEYYEQGYPGFSMDSYRRELTEVSTSASGVPDYEGLGDVVMGDGRESNQDYRHMLIGTGVSGLARQASSVRTKQSVIALNDWQYPDGETVISDTTDPGALTLSDVLCSIQPALFASASGGTITRRRRTASFGPGGAGGCTFIDNGSYAPGRPYTCTYTEISDQSSGSLTLEVVSNGDYIQSGTSSYNFHSLIANATSGYTEEQQEEGGEFVRVDFRAAHKREVTISGSWDGKYAVTVTTIRTLDKDWRGSDPEPPDNWVVIGPTTTSVVSAIDPYEEQYDAKVDEFKEHNIDYQTAIERLDPMSHDDCEAWAYESNSTVSDVETTTVATPAFNIQP